MQLLRTQSNLTQAQLAERVAEHGVVTAGSVLSRIETGDPREPSARLMIAIADALRVPVRRLFAEENDETWSDYDRTLEEFLASPWALGITPAELAALPGAMWLGGVFTVQGWYHALMMVRSALRGSP
jgi:transcriptional regulator with XRE-family HTH domain